MDEQLIDMKTLYSIVGKSGDLDKAEIISYGEENMLPRITIVTDYLDDLDIRKFKRNLKAVGIKVTGFFIEGYIPKTNVPNYYKISIKFWIEKI